MQASSRAPGGHPGTSASLFPRRAITAAAAPAGFHAPTRPLLSPRHPSVVEQHRPYPAMPTLATARRALPVGVAEHPVRINPCALREARSRHGAKQRDHACSAAWAAQPTSAPSVWRGRYQACESQPPVRHETLRWPMTPGPRQLQGVQLTDTVPGRGAGTRRHLAPVHHLRHRDHRRRHRPPARTAR